MALSDYNNRTIDVMFSENYTGKLSLKFSNNIVTGIQKAVQRFVIKLFESRGSNIFHPTDGTLFAKDMVESLGQSDAGGAIQSLALSFSDVVDQLRLTPSVHSDENIASISIEGYTAEKDTFDVSLLLTTESGEDYRFILPFNSPII